MVERRKAAYASASRFSGVNKGHWRVALEHAVKTHPCCHTTSTRGKSVTVRRLEIALRSESHLSSARPTIPPKLQLLNAKIHEREVAFL
jgi:hypothetical protein